MWIWSRISVKAVTEQEFAEWLKVAKTEFANDTFESDNIAAK